MQHLAEKDQSMISSHDCNNFYWIPRKICLEISHTNFNFLFPRFWPFWESRSPFSDLFWVFFSNIGKCSMNLGNILVSKAEQSSWFNLFSGQGYCLNNSPLCWGGWEPSYILFLALIGNSLLSHKMSFLLMKLMFKSLFRNFHVDFETKWNHCVISLARKIFLEIIFRLGINRYMSLFPSVCPSICHTQYPRNQTPYAHNFWYTCKMMISPGAFFIFKKF